VLLPTDPGCAQNKQTTRPTSKKCSFSSEAFALLVPLNVHFINADL
jgi:hypothetical protein